MAKLGYNWLEVGSIWLKLGEQRLEREVFVSQLVLRIYRRSGNKRENRHDYLMFEGRLFGRILLPPELLNSFVCEFGRRSIFHNVARTGQTDEKKTFRKQIGTYSEQRASVERSFGRSLHFGGGHPGAGRGEVFGKVWGKVLGEVFGLVLLEHSEQKKKGQPKTPAPNSHGSAQQNW